MKYNTGVATIVQAIIKLGEREDRILTIIRGKYGLKNKSDAINFVLDQFEKELLEPELRPAFVNKIKDLEKKGKFKEYTNLSALKSDLEHA